MKPGDMVKAKQSWPPPDCPRELVGQVVAVSRCGWVLVQGRHYKECFWKDEVEKL